MKSCKLIVMVTLVVLSLSYGGVSVAETLTGTDLTEGKTPAVGDVVLLDQFEQCFPKSAIDSTNIKGKWRLRSYKTNDQFGKMLCVDERDMENPQSCIAPTLTYPLHLDGVYEIWVGVYRPIYGGGIDIKLTRDKVFFPIDPREDGLKKWPPSEEQVGTLVECFCKTDDLTGQNIQIRQPHGTYDSFWWGLCNAHLAYIKLVRRDPQDVVREKDKLTVLQRKGVIVDLDGFSYVWEWGVPNIDCILQQIEPYQYGNAEAINWCIGGSIETNFPHPMTSGRIRTMDRLGDKRATGVYQAFEEQRCDVLQVLADRCHELGLKLYASHRANVHYYENNVWDEHPEWRLKEWGGLDYALPEVRDFYRDFLLYIPRNYDVDGLTIDFTRHRRHFNPGQENQLELMDAYVRDLRAGLNKISEERGRRLDLNASFTCGTWYDGTTPESQGLDVATWVKEGIFDRIMPEGRDAVKYIGMCENTNVKCYPRYCNAMDFEANALQNGVHDPTPQEDKKDAPPLASLAPLDIAAGALKWYKAGASGIFLFNMSPQTPLRHLPYPELLRAEVDSGQPYGRRVIGKVCWIDEQDAAPSNPVE